MSTSPTLRHEHTTVSPADISATENLSRWIFERVQSFITGQVLEVNSGAGNLATYCSQQNIHTGVLPVNLYDDPLNTLHADLLNTLDTLIALHAAQNVVSYPQVITNCAKMLKKEGHLIIQLPTCTALYNGLNQGFRRWKLYNMQFIHKILSPHFRIMKTRYFMITDNDSPSSQQATKYSERVTQFNRANATDFNQTGLSVIVVGRKR